MAEHAGLPPAAVQILCGGFPAGAALAAHPDIDQPYLLARSQPERLRHSGSANLVPCVLELGGKSAAIVRADADLANLVENVRWGIFFNSGQVRPLRPGSWCIEIFIANSSDGYLNSQRLCRSTG